MDEPNFGSVDISSIHRNEGGKESLQFTNDHQSEEIKVCSKILTTDSKQLESNETTEEKHTGPKVVRCSKITSEVLDIDNSKEFIDFGDRSSDSKKRHVSSLG